MQNEKHLSGKIGRDPISPKKSARRAATAAAMGNLGDAIPLANAPEVVVRPDENVPIGSREREPTVFILLEPLKFLDEVEPEFGRNPGGEFKGNIPVRVSAAITA